MCSQFMKDSGIEVCEISNPDMTFRFPDLPHQISENREAVANRDFDKSKFKQFNALIREYWKNPEGNLSTLDELSKEIEAFFNWDMVDRIFHVKMRYMPYPTDNRHIESDGLISHLLNKTIILMEEADHYG